MLRRFSEDRIGLFSVMYIIVMIFVAVFAYYIAPDDSSNANQMHLSIHSKPPGFSSQILILPNSNADQGTEEIAIDRLIWKEGQLFYNASGTPIDYVQPIDLSRYPSKTSYLDVEKNYVQERKFLLGTDKYGRDLLSRVLIGSRISLSIGFIAVLISLVVGVFIGAIAGYFGGTVDRFMVWLINVVWVHPNFINGYWYYTCSWKRILAGFYCSRLDHVGRSSSSSSRSGHLNQRKNLRTSSTCFRDTPTIELSGNTFLPIVIPPLIVISAANFASAILIESGLSFLGIGAQPPVPSWGGMIKDHFRYILLGKPYLAVVPGLAIMSLVLAFMTLGNSLRDALDVKA